MRPRQKEIKVSFVQANHVPQYALASLIFAKTYKVHARVLCAFLIAIQP